MTVGHGISCLASLGFSSISVKQECSEMTSEVPPAVVFYASGTVKNIFLDLVVILNLEKWAGISFLLYCLLWS